MSPTCRPATRSRASRTSTRRRPWPKCHSPTGYFAGLATRLQGLQLLQRMLYPAEAGAEAGRAAAVQVRTVTV